MKDAKIIYNFTTIINTKEEFLPFVRTSVLIMKKESEVHAIGLRCYSPSESLPEFDSLKHRISFKKTSSESSEQQSYQITVNIGYYSSEDINIEGYGKPVDLLLLVYYKNLRGEYEFRQIKS